ncbi:MAG: hypothetical protein V8T86_04950 [Victivallis sp.]|jgi:hypothetical protein|uniref:hypothetical protein n=1 Tax=uncultured Victivallis sp. TaxID=354118 RepID=UPI000D028637|nr:hypothetical protein [uncultured Victivallis sp.]AVM46845.1 hypothetical protein C5Q97_19840 [Victivallales bacterium CCUG 44730]
MGLFDAIAISSSLSLIAGVCILLEAWCLVSETKDRKGFFLAWALLAQFALPVLLTWLCREGVVPFRPAYLLLEYAVSLPAAAAVLAALCVLASNRHRIPELTVYGVWTIVFAAGTFLLQLAVHRSVFD